MTIDKFWKLIEQVKDDEEPEVGLDLSLRKLAPEELISYQEHFDALVRKAYRWDLWGAAYIMEGGCSDDGFIDFRYGLIAQGRDVYDAALENPDSLADLEIEGISNELFGYVAEEVYEEVTGEDEMPRKPVQDPPEPLGEEWDFDDPKENARRLPKLWARYGEG